MGCSSSTDSTSAPAGGQKKQSAPVAMETTDKTITVYFFPGSFYSAKVLIGLTLKGVKYEEKHVNLLEFETYAPWYMGKINKQGQMPSFQHGEKTLAGSDVILDYIEKNCGGQKLWPDDCATEVQSLIDSFDAINVFALTFGAIQSPDLYGESLLAPEMWNALSGWISNNVQKQTLEKYMAENPDDADLQAIYKKKLENLHYNLDNCTREIVEKNLKVAEEAFEKAEKQLEKSTEGGSKDAWLFGDSLTAADITLMVSLNRLCNVGLSKLWAQKPLVSKFHSRVKAEKSDLIALCGPF